MGSGSSKKKQNNLNRSKSRDSIESAPLDRDDVSMNQTKRTTYVSSANRNPSVLSADDDDDEIDDLPELQQTQRTNSRKQSSARENFCSECPHCTRMNYAAKLRTPIDQQPIWVMRNPKDIGDSHINMDKYDEEAVKKQSSPTSNRHDYLPTVAFPSRRTSGALSTNYYRSSMITTQNNSRYTPTRTPY